MAQQTTALGFPYYEGTDSPAGHSQQQVLAEFLDANPGIGSFTQTQINAFTTSQKRAGRVIYNSTTGKLQQSDGSSWFNISAVTVAATQPAALATGDLWLDTSAEI